MNAITIRAVIDGRDVPRDEVLAWEDKRMRKAARKIGLPIPDGDLAQRRRSFAEAKLRLGHRAVRDRLARDVRLAGATFGGAARLSRGRRRMSVCDLHVNRGRAGEFTDWFTQHALANDELSMLAASPDHFLLHADSTGKQEIIETTGGSPLAARFVVDLDDHSSLVSQPDPTFDHELAGVARTLDGAPLGGVRHQFRDEHDGFHARLCVEFPLLTPGYLIAQHRWHLACEFSNWIEFALADARGDARTSNGP
jgi:hypothetical protein